MTAGRPRKPIETKILQGTFRPDRDGGAMVRAGGTPRPPAHLKGEPLALWKKIVPDLVAKALVGESDSHALAILVEWLARYKKIAAALDALEVGDETYGRLSALAGSASQHFERWASRFGLTPSDRAKLRVEAAPAARVSSRKRG